jgi:hypothetical protein
MSSPPSRFAPWRVSGSYFEACNCEAICPCRKTGGRPGGRSTYGICDFALSWLVTDGDAQEFRAELMRVEQPPLRWEVRGRCAFATDFSYSSDEG